MEKQEIILTINAPKKHSVRFSNKSVNAALSDVYIKRFALDSAIPKKIKITIEDVN